MRLRHNSPGNNSILGNTSMLPLTQMHQMVQVPPHLDRLASHHPHQHLKPDYFPAYHASRNPRPADLYQNVLDAAPRGLALGNVQLTTPSIHRITTTLSHACGQSYFLDGGIEHSLRRKTPSGTIDNGYDGSPAHLASGPPPLKQMVLPTSTQLFPTAVVSRASGISGGGVFQQPVPAGEWSYGVTAPTTLGSGLGHHVLGNSAAVGVWGQGPSGMALDLAAGAPIPLMQHVPEPNYQSASNLHPRLGPTFQQAAGLTAFPPLGYQQANTWREAGLTDYGVPVPLANSYTPQNAVVDSAFMPAHSVFHGLSNGPGLGHIHPFKLPMASHALDDGFSRPGHNQSSPQVPHHRLESLSLNSPNIGPYGKGVTELSSPARFKERALSVAHKTYGELLVYLSQSKRNQHGQGASASRSLSKMMVFPKPSRHHHHHHHHHHSASLSLSKARQISDTMPTYSQHLAQKQAADRAFAFGSRPPSAARSMSQGGGNHQIMVDNQTALAQMQSSASLQRNPYPGKNRGGVSDLNSPVLNAKASLDMISTLCEQSGWKWVDGMLLGGCLHYGLEHYEDALEWFRRIVSLDETHVEAISNIAATLYCLNRQTEAEQHWWQALKIRPSYLEAAEHLVSLLCANHRSQEAVATIQHIQEALRKRSDSAVRQEEATGMTSGADTKTRATVCERLPDHFMAHGDNSADLKFLGGVVDGAKSPGFGSSGYAVAGSENGRMLLLIHAKGNMLYALKDIDRASQAFEEAVLISTGRHVRGVQALIREIQAVLTPRHFDAPPSKTPGGVSALGPLLLPPEMAKNTASLVFESSAGQLPGLAYVPEGSHRRSAVSTTSNSLLSLAKIFQDAMSNGGTSPGLMRQPAGVGDILALYYLSLSLQESPSTANNVGILLASVQQSSIQNTSITETSTATTIPGIAPGSGLALALQYYNYGLTLDPKHVHLHTNLGSLLKDIGQLDMAIKMYEEAVRCDGTFDIALTNLANAVKDRGRIADAIRYYKRAVAANADFAEAVCGLSTALNSVCDWAGRGGVLVDGGRFDRWHVNDENQLVDVKSAGSGSGLMKRVADIVGRQLKEASSWGTGILQERTIREFASQLRDAGADQTDRSLDLVAELCKWAGRPWEGSRVLRLIERSVRCAMRSRYRDKYINGVQRPGGYPRPRLPASLSVPSAPTVLPFHTFTCPLTAKDIRMISERNALRISCSTLRSPWLPTTVYEPPSPPSPHLNIGYVSSDFNNHPLAHLMQSVFGFHDQRRAKAFCYATTASDKSVHRKQIEREAPTFRDVSSWSSDKLVEQIVKDGIHILVNLNGYTRGARNEVFAARPAPIQMSFMGFAGTLGAEWCDYLLADTTAIPPSTLRPYRRNLNLRDVFRDEAEDDAGDWVYAENIIFCRDTFFCCDHAQSADDAGERHLTWEEEQRRRWKMRKELFPNLPDDAIILGNFNQLYKIDPTTFRTWLRILGDIPNAVLWLLRFPELGENNLRRTAAMWSHQSVADRIIFTDVAPKQQHISRARVCDLFLDTPECNAHTTAADILWSSTPLLTLPRYEYKMCSRMAASILKGALPKGPQGEQAAQELIASDDATYEDLAKRLALGFRYRMTADGYGEGVGRLAELRRLLWESKWTCALFDTRRWVRDLEDAYDEAWRRWVAGESGDIYL